MIKPIHAYGAMVVVIIVGVLAMVGMVVLSVTDNALSRGGSSRSFQDAIHCRTNDGISFGCGH